MLGDPMVDACEPVARRECWITRVATEIQPLQSDTDRLLVQPCCQARLYSSLCIQTRTLVARRECGAVISRVSVVHKLMDAMSSALKLRGAGLTPHFHAERSSNGSCGGPPPVRSWSGRWKNPRRRLMSQLYSVLQSVPLGRSVHGPVAR